MFLFLFVKFFKHFCTIIVHIRDTYKELKPLSDIKAKCTNLNIRDTYKELKLF